MKKDRANARNHSIENAYEIILKKDRGNARNHSIENAYEIYFKETSRKRKELLDRKCIWNLF